jgi:hypothetical protein
MEKDSLKMAHSSKPHYVTSDLPLAIEVLNFDLGEHHVDSVRVKAKQVNTSKRSIYVVSVSLLEEPYSLECPSLKKLLIENTPCFSAYDGKLKTCRSCQLNTDCKNQR